MEGKRLDLDAPLISVRRINASSALSKDAKPQSRRGLLRSGHEEHSGEVPFIWEKMPGLPKENSGEVVGPVVAGITAAPYIPPDRILLNASRPKPNAVGTQMPTTCSSDCGTEKLITERVGFNPADYGDERDAFSDARDTLSCNEFTGLSAFPSLADSNGQFFKDLQMEEYMMGRFLPAAEAMVSGSSQRKPPRAPAVDRHFERKTLPRVRLPLHYRYHFSLSASSGNGRKKEVEDVEEEEEESDEIVNHDESTGYFSSKARRLISRFGLKSSFFLLKPVPGMKVRDLPSKKLGCMSMSRITVSNDEGTVEGDSWETVCKHRLMNLDYIQKDIESKLTIDSQTPDSSSFQVSSVDDLSTNKTADVKSKSKSSKTDNSLIMSLLPPPLPKSPSDSWLQRTLPGISEKGPNQKPFLGIQFHPIKQASQVSRGGQNLVIPENSSKTHPYQTTFVGVPKSGC